MTKNKLIPLNFCVFILLATTCGYARAEYYYACSQPAPLVERVAYYSSERPEWIPYRYHHSCSQHKHHYKRLKHHYHYYYAQAPRPIPRRHSSYNMSVYYVWPAVPPCPSCDTGYSYPAPCRRCETGYWQAPNNDTYYETRSPYYYEDTYDQDLRTDDDGGAEMNIDN